MCYCIWFDNVVLRIFFIYIQMLGYILFFSSIFVWIWHIGDGHFRSFFIPFSFFFFLGFLLDVDSMLCINPIGLMCCFHLLNFLSAFWLGDFCYSVYFLIDFLCFFPHFICFLTELYYFCWINIVCYFHNPLDCRLDYFLRKSCIAMNLPLRTAFAEVHRFCIVVFSCHLSWSIFWSPLWPHCRPTDILFSLHAYPTVYSSLGAVHWYCTLPTYESSNCELSKMGICIHMSSHVS